MLLGLMAPSLVALTMIAQSSYLIQDFFGRLFLLKIDLPSLVMLLCIIPATFFLATGLSLLFGQSKEQFSLAKELNVMKGWRVLSLIIPILLAPTLEEIAWRGYGVDSLRSHFNLFYTSILFGVLWSLWHLPLCFIQGYYQYQLRIENIIYLINFFVSIIPAAFIMNWIFYRNCRSILLIVFAHALLNGLSVFFKTEQLTKCIFTVLLFIVATVVVIEDKDFFFEKETEVLCP